MHSHLQPFCLYLMIHASKQSDFWIIKAFIYYKFTCQISTKAGLCCWENGSWSLLLHISYFVATSYIHIIECQCKNCYAFIKITKSEYSLIKEEFICSIHFMSWDEHIFIAWLTHGFLSLGCMRTCNIFRFSLHEDMQHIECGGMLGR